MTYSSYETGPIGSPVELFLFQGGGYCWQYTSADVQVTFGGRVYRPVTISRGSFERNDEAGSNSVSVRIDRTLTVAGQFIDGSTPAPVRLTIFRKHRSDVEYIILFKGIVANAELTGQEVALNCISPLSSEEKSVPREIIMRTCPHVLYGPRCQLDPTDWAYAGTITSITNSIVVVSGIANLGNDYFNAGVLIHNETGFQTFVQDSNYYYGGNRFILLQPPPSYWAVTDAVTALAGCNRKHTACRDKFNNIPNFGGFPLHPERNPLLDLSAD